MGNGQGDVVAAKQFGKFLGRFQTIPTANKLAMGIGAEEPREKPRFAQHLKAIANAEDAATAAHKFFHRPHDGGFLRPWRPTANNRHREKPPGRNTMSVWGGRSWSNAGCNTACRPVATKMARARSSCRLLPSNTTITESHVFAFSFLTAILANACWQWLRIFLRGRRRQIVAPPPLRPPRLTRCQRSSQELLCFYRRR